MKNEEFIAAKELLRDSGVSLIQAARIVLNILDGRRARKSEVYGLSGAAHAARSTASTRSKETASSEQAACSAQDADSARSVQEERTASSVEALGTTTAAPSAIATNSVSSAHSAESAFDFCAKVVEIGLRGIGNIQMSISEGFGIYLKAKEHLRPDSLRDIRYLGRRLLNAKPDFALRNFSDMSFVECGEWLGGEFESASQFNKARAMLHGLFAFAVRRGWCERNLVGIVERRKVIEKEIRPLKISEAVRLLKTAQTPRFKDCAGAVAILTLAGVRPCELRRLLWRDVDLSENAITIRSICSKTGGVRQVDICPALRRILLVCVREPFATVCPPNWAGLWRGIRESSGFKGVWVQDVLRHTYASFHAKHFRNLPRLQLNMGHANQLLLRSRYVNMHGISSADARAFFAGVGN